MPSTTDTQQRRQLPSVRDVWTGLSREEKVEALVAFLSDQDNQRKILSPLSRQLHFREATLQRYPMEWKASRLAPLMIGSDFSRHLADVLKSFHFEKRRDLMIAFLDAAQIPHENGGIDGEWGETPKVDQLMAGYEFVRQKFSLPSIKTYFQTLLALEGDGGTWMELPSILDRIEEENETGPTNREEEAPPEVDTVPTRPESSEEFTTLDNLLIQTIVNTALKIDGAPSREQLDDLTGELLSLSGSRKRSFFHRGFFDTMFSQEVCVSHQGENSESRLWYAAGAVMGWIRSQQANRVIALFSEQPTVLEEVVNDANPCRIRMLLPVLYPVLRDNGLHQSAVRILNAGLGKLRPHKHAEMCHLILTDASALLRVGDASTAFLYLDTLPELDFEQDIPDYLAGYGRRLIRKKAQCLQMLGQMEAAEERLKYLSGLGDFEESIEAITDLGLVLGGFQSIYDMLPSDDPETYATRIVALQRGKPFFEEAVAREAGVYTSKARNARFALGVLTLFQRDAEQSAVDAARQLNLALTGMMRDEAAYRAGNLIDWAKFLLALANLETLDESRLTNSSSNIRQVLNGGVQWPAWLLFRCMDAAAIHDDRQLVMEVTDAILKVDEEEAFSRIRTTDVLNKFPALLEKYAHWIAASLLPLPRRVEEWKLILHLALQGSNITLAEKALEQLEALAHEWKDFVDEFLRMLEDAQSYSPAWTPSDAEEASVQLLEAYGRFSEAAEFLKRRFWAARIERTPQAKADCEAILAALEEMNISADDLKALKQNMPELADESLRHQTEVTARKKLENGGKISVLFVGGNETQAQYDRQIEDEVREMFSGVAIEFHHPGWGSSWSGLCDIIENKLPSYDAVVLSHLVRTNMGRRMRKMCGAATPWFACRGRGAASIKQSIVQAAIRSCEMQTVNPQV